MKNFWIFPEQASHNEFLQRVGEVLKEGFWKHRLAGGESLPEAAYHAASEIRFAGLSDRQMAACEKVAHELGWSTQREGEDYRR